MKILKKLFLINLSLFMGLFAPSIISYCKTHDGKHLDKKVHRCEYTQEDIKRGFAKCPDRYKCMGIDEHTCFYCGCHINHHSKKQKD